MFDYNATASTTIVYGRHGEIRTVSSYENADEVVGYITEGLHADRNAFISIHTQENNSVYIRADEVIMVQDNN